MTVQTLAELKAQNEAEAKKTPVTPQNTDVEADAPGDEDLDALINEAVSETSEEDETKLESWQLSDDVEDGKEDEKSNAEPEEVPLHAHIKMRAKLKGKLSETNEEVKALRAKLEAYEKGVVQPSAPVAVAVPPKPKLEDFGWDETKFNAALDAWDDARLEAKLSKFQQTNQQKSQMQNAQSALNESVEQHYKRAAELAKKSGIAADVYQKADLNFRTVIDDVFPGRGDLIADQLIANLGEGSEKIAYFIGRNKAAQAELKAALVADPSGVKAAIWLGKKAADSSANAKRTSQAPKPAPVLSGNVAIGNSAATKLKEAYEKAHNKGDHQTAYNAKKKAKQAGINVSDW